MIEIRNLHKSYGSVRALNGIDLTVGKGEFFGLLGPNGAGKSTLMHILTGLLSADRGEVVIGETAQPAARGSLLGLVPQEIALYVDLSARANLEIFGGLYGLKPAEVRSRGKDLLRLVNLADRASEKVKTFSGGMKRRLNLAVSLLHQPQCLLCDEPTAGVDPQSRHAIFELLEALNKDGLTIIYTTHYMEEVERLCSRIGIIDDGVVCAIGTRTELLGGAQQGLGEVRLHDCPELSLLVPAIADHGELVSSNGYTQFLPVEAFSLSRLADLVQAIGFPRSCLEIRRPSLEQRFLELTGKALRE